MDVPRVPANFVPANAGETFMLGKIQIRILEDGSRTDLSLTGTRHDETFLVTEGTIRFHGLDGQIIDAHQGDYVTVPTRSVHTFSNPTDKPCKFFNTYTPAFYINYFKMLAQLVEAGSPMTAEANRRAMAYFATIGVSEDVMRSPEDRKQSEVAQNGGDNDRTKTNTTTTTITDHKE